MAIMVATGAGFDVTRAISQIRENSSLTASHTMRDVVDEVKQKSVEGLSGKQYRTMTNLSVTTDNRVNVVL